MKSKIKKGIKKIFRPVYSRLEGYITDKINNSYIPINNKIQNHHKLLKSNYEFKFKKITPQPILSSLEYHLCEHCNLNCLGCDNFSPLAGESYEDINRFMKDMERFSLLTYGKLKVLKLLGGEPLLHPEIENFIRVSRQYFPNTKIIIITNAIKLIDMPDSFFTTCFEYNITISPTKYPINIPWDTIKNKMKKFSLKLEFFDGENTVKTLYHMTLDLFGTQDPVESFLNCYHANNCIFLREGKLYPCSVAPNIHHFNKFFGVNLEVDDDDYIDIFNVNSYKEISSFISKPIPFCRYCNIKSRTFGHKWMRSERQIKEWT